MEPSAPAGGAKPSKAEAIKLASEYLKIQIAGELGNGASHFSEDAAGVLKFHGSYQQDDRDQRTRLKKEGKEKAFQFMIRVRVVGGRLTAEQYLACDHLAETIGNGTPAHHDEAGVSAPRRPATRPQDYHRPDQRGPAFDAGGLWRCRAQRTVLSRSDLKCAP